MKSPKPGCKKIFSTIYGSGKIFAVISIK